MKKFLQIVTAAAIIGSGFVTPALQTSTEAAANAPLQVPSLVMDVIIIPGIIGSELTFNGQTIWPPSENPAQMKQQLAMVDVNADGTSIPGVQVTKALAPYEAMGQQLATLGYRTHVFAYDWRLDLAENEKKLEAFIQEKGLNKFSIIAHSMGGLVATSYMAKNENQLKVDKFISLATPFLGTPKTLWVMETGKFIDNPQQSDELNQYFKNLSRKMTSSYELLPTKDYFTANNPSYITAYINSNVQPIMGYDATQAFLRQQKWPVLSQGAPALAQIDYHLTKTEAFQQSAKIIATLDQVKDKSYFIVGDGQETVGKIGEEYVASAGGMKQYTKLEARILGDGTVPAASANVYGRYGNRTYYTDADHSAMLGNMTVGYQVASILTGVDAKLLRQKQGKEKEEMRITSNQELHVFDAKKNHTGRLPVVGYYDEKIPGSLYYDDEKSSTVYVPKGSYQITMKQTKEQPTTLSIESIDAQNRVKKTILFENVTISKNGVAAVQEMKGEMVLAVDENGDGTPERIVQPTQK